AGQPARWGTDDQTAVMLRRDRPSASRVLNFISAGQPPRAVVGDDSGADNVLRCDPPSATNREAYLKISASLRTTGARGDAELIDRALSKSDGNSTATPVPTRSNGGTHAATAPIQNGSETHFPNHARLIYSAPVSPELSRTFGPGWTRLTITRPDGTTLPIVPDEALTADGGVIFSAAGSNARSHDGRYFVLDLTRNGVTETEDGKPTVASREFCPILDTQTGCVARDYTGAVCGGKWDEKDAIWRSQLDSGKADSQSMTTLDKPTAQAVWTQFSKSNSTDIKPFLRVALGIENLRACDPPSAENAAYYAQIKTALGAYANVASTPAPGGAAPANAAEPPIWTVQADRSWLYERPSVGSNRRGYLIRGDHVSVIGEEKPDWVRIRYTRAGKAPLEAWMKRQDIVSAN
ncbi:MAG TPA: SH3 domain-containing protein, partial [Trinickia sp.]|nr:SH3 domain-containing protein [Trinickia sp.]